MNTVDMSPLNPAELKIDLTLKGVRLDPGAHIHTKLVPYSGRAEGTQNVELVLADDVCVTVAVDESQIGESPYVLSGYDAACSLRRNGTSVAVRLVGPPAFYGETTSAGRPMWRVGTVYGGSIAINAAAACSVSLAGAPCRFCRSGSGSAIGDSFPMSVSEVVEVVRAAFAEGAVEFVYFNPPYTGNEDAGIAFLEPYIRAVKKHFNTLVAVQTHPPTTNRWIDRTYAMGVDALSYPIEIHNSDVLARRCPGRVRRIGIQRYYDALTYAASVFPSGTVWSELVVGIEPPESTVSGIDMLVSMGVLPVLSVLRSSDDTAIGDWPREPEGFRTVFAHLFNAVRRSPINMGWIRDLSFAVTPFEARFFADEDTRGVVALPHFYRSRLGSLTTRGLSRLRRRLRVRTISDSFDASRL